MSQALQGSGYIVMGNSGHISSLMDVTGEETSSEKFNIVPKFNH